MTDDEPCDCEDCVRQRVEAVDATPEEVLAAWQAWFRSAGGDEWDKVEDIEKELGRDSE